MTVKPELPRRKQQGPPSQRLFSGLNDLQAPRGMCMGGGWDRGSAGSRGALGAVAAVLLLAAAAAQRCMQDSAPGLAVSVVVAHCAARDPVAHWLVSVVLLPPGGLQEHVGLGGGGAVAARAGGRRRAGAIVL